MALEYGKLSPALGGPNGGWVWEFQSENQSLNFSSTISMLDLFNKLGLHNWRLCLSTERTWWFSRQLP